MSHAVIKIIADTAEIIVETFVVHTVEVVVHASEIIVHVSKIVVHASKIVVETFVVHATEVVVITVYMIAVAIGRMAIITNVLGNKTDVVYGVMFGKMNMSADVINGKTSMSADLINSKMCSPVAAETRSGLPTRDCTSAVLHFSAAAWPHVHDSWTPRATAILRYLGCATRPRMSNAALSPRATVSAPRAGPAASAPGGCAAV